MSFQNCKIVGDAQSPELYHSVNDHHDRGSGDWVVTSSMLREFGRCARRWLDGYQPPKSAAMDFGSLLDCRLLTPDQFETRYAIQPSVFRAGDLEKAWHNGATACKEWVAAQCGRQIVNRAEIDAANAAASRIQDDEILHSFLLASQRQVWIKGEWSSDGCVVPVQCLIDLAPAESSEFSSCLGDLKTTRSASPHQWRQWSSQRGYHVQGALCVDLWNAATAQMRDTWCFVVVESFAPWQTARRMLSLEKLNFGRQRYQALLSRYCRCLKTGDWPDYDATPAALQGWTLDEATKYDEAEAMESLAELVAPSVVEPDMEDIIP